MRSEMEYLYAMTPPWVVALILVIAGSAVLLWAIRRRRNTGAGGDIPAYGYDEWSPTLDYTAAMDAVGTDQDEYQREQKLKEAARKREAARHRWEWVPWSRVRRWTIAALREDLDYARANSERQAELVDFYRRHIINGTRPSVKASRAAEYAAVGATPPPGYEGSDEPITSDNWWRRS